MARIPVVRKSVLLQLAGEIVTAWALEHVTAAQATVMPSAETVPVPSAGDAADDVAIWIHPNDRPKSTVIGRWRYGSSAAGRTRNPAAIRSGSPGR